MWKTVLKSSHSLSYSVTIIWYVVFKSIFVGQIPKISLFLGFVPNTFSLVVNEISWLCHLALGRKKTEAIFKWSFFCINFVIRCSGRLFVILTNLVTLVNFFFQFCSLIRNLDFFLQRVFKGTSVRTLNFCIWWLEVRDVRDAIGETADVTWYEFSLTNVS